LIGGAFAVVIAFAFDGGLLHLPMATGGDPPSRASRCWSSASLPLQRTLGADTLAVAVPSMAEKDKPRSPEAREAA
jgi:hypothetical protein